MNQVYLLIGGNIGDRLNNLRTARQLITDACGKIINASGIYETAAWGIREQPDFLNQILLIETLLEPEALLDALLNTELRMGRVRQEKLGPRTIDLDILFYENRIIDKPHLSIPHPQLPNRRFVLYPLSEIAPDLIHPVLQKTMMELLESCTDNGHVEKKYPSD